MAEPFLAEIRIMSFAFAPKGWAACNGQLLPINQNQALFALLGTTFGGDGRTTFALPSLQGRVPIHGGGGHTNGEPGGSPTAPVAPGALAAHTHSVLATSSPASTGTPSPTVGLAKTKGNLYAPADANLQPMAANAVAPSGDTQPHQNMQPFLGLNFCIALQGIFPSRD
jgi:microcystin-dependent protein